jgi:hypothetical protein
VVSSETTLWHPAGKSQRFFVFQNINEHVMREMLTVGLTKRPDEIKEEQESPKNQFNLRLRLPEQRNEPAYGPELCTQFYSNQFYQWNSPLVLLEDFDKARLAVLKQLDSGSKAPLIVAAFTTTCGLLNLVVTQTSLQLKAHVATNDSPAVVMVFSRLHVLVEDTVAYVNAAKTNVKALFDTIVADKATDTAPLASTIRAALQGFSAAANALSIAGEATAHNTIFLSCRQKCVNARESVDHARHHMKNKTAFASEAVALDKLIALVNDGEPRMCVAFEATMVALSENMPAACLPDGSCEPWLGCNHAKRVLLGQSGPAVQVATGASLEAETIAEPVSFFLKSRIFARCRL